MYEIIKISEFRSFGFVTMYEVLKNKKQVNLFHTLKEAKEFVGMLKNGGFNNV